MASCALAVGPLVKPRTCGRRKGTRSIMLADQPVLACPSHRRMLTGKKR